MRAAERFLERGLGPPWNFPAVRVTAHRDAQLRVPLLRAVPRCGGRRLRAARLHLTPSLTRGAKPAAGFSAPLPARVSSGISGACSARLFVLVSQPWAVASCPRTRAYEPFSLMQVVLARCRQPSSVLVRPSSDPRISWANPRAMRKDAATQEHACAKKLTQLCVFRSDVCSWPGASPLAARPRRDFALDGEEEGRRRRRCYRGRCGAGGKGGRCG